MSSLRRGAAATVAVVMALSALTACGSDDEFSYTANSAYNPVDGVALDSTYVVARDVRLIAAEGTTPPQLNAVLVNPSRTADALIGATAGEPAVAGRLVGGVAGALPVPAGATVAVGATAPTQITFPGLNAGVSTWTNVTLLFQSGKSVTSSVLVSNAVSQFSDGTVPTATPAAQRDRAKLEAELSDTADEPGAH